VKGIWIDCDNAVRICKIIELRQPFHIIGILIHGVKQEHNGITLLRVVALWKTYYVRAVHIIDMHLLAAFLGEHNMREQKHTEEVRSEFSHSPNPRRSLGRSIRSSTSNSSIRNSIPTSAAIAQSMVSVIVVDAVMDDEDVSVPTTVSV
jgi:hypothetical protein